jgi:hypothetical protein
MEDWEGFCYFLPKSNVVDSGTRYEDPEINSG